MSRELAFYYPNPMWSHSDWVKNLVLFFEGVALLVPTYMRDRPYLLDPATVRGLENHGLLTILEPESLIDQQATEELASGMMAIIESGSLDRLAGQATAFQELSYSRLGGGADEQLARTILKGLRDRGLAKDTEDGVSIPMHPMVRSLVLVLLAQILRRPGQERGLELCPATDIPEVEQALRELLSTPAMASSGHVVSLDLQAVGVDLSSVPIEEVLAFRADHHEEYRAYARGLRQFMREASRYSAEHQVEAMKDRKETIEDEARRLRKSMRKLAKTGSLRACLNYEPRRDRVEAWNRDDRIAVT